MGELAYMVPQMLFALPAIVTLVVGLALLWARRERLGSRPRMLGMAGLVVLLVGALLNMAYLAALPSYIRDYGFHESQVMFAGTSLMFLTLHVLGLALLIAALVATARPIDPWGQAPPPETAPGPEGG